jgi:hypothetical protein
MLFGAEGFELDVEVANALVEVINRVQKFSDEQGVGSCELSADLFGEGHGFDRGGDEDPEALEEETRGVDERDATAQESLSDLKSNEGALRRFAAVPNGAEQLRISATKSGERARVFGVGLGVAHRNRAEFASVGDDHAIPTGFE